MAARTKKATVEDTVQEVTEQGQAQFKQIVETSQVQMTSMMEQSRLLMQENFNLWNDYTTLYNTMFVEGTQMLLNQSLTYREEMGGMLADNWQKAQALMVKQQELAVQNVERVNQQMQASYEQNSRLFTPK